MKTITPYDSITRLEAVDLYNRIADDMAKKHKLDEETLHKYEEATEELRESFACEVMRADRVGGLVLDSGCSAVDPRHFDRIEYLAVWNFLECICCDSRPLWQARHELALMLQEIHDLRNVLADRCGIDWYEYRKKFPLLAQDYV